MNHLRMDVRDLNNNRGPGLAMAVDGLIAHLEHSVSLPEHLIQSFSDFANGQGLEGIDAEVLKLKAQKKKSDGRLLESVIDFENCLKINPLSITNQAAWVGFMDSVHEELQKMGSLDPGNPEFGRTYEKLLELGWIGLPCHIYAVHHYFLSGNLSRATEIAQRISLVAPNYIGLTDLSKAIKKATDPHSSIERMQTDSTGIPALPEVYDLELIAEYTKKLVAIKSCIDRDQYQEGLELTNQVLGKSSRVEGPLSDFFYYKAICLDMLGQIYDAFEIFWRLKTGKPHVLQYERSYRILCQRFTAFARELWEKNPQSPTLQRYHAVLLQHYYSPHWLTVAVCQQQAAGGQTEQAKQTMLNLFSLNPMDPDYLSGCFRIAAAIGDSAWLGELKQALGELLQTRPYDLRLHEIRCAYSNFA